MAQVTSLGIHTPTALQYCITERLLPDPPPPGSYQWTITPTIPDEELLVTGDTVIWSQGGIIQRVYRFTAEKEPVQQALFAWFEDEDEFLALKKGVGGTRDVVGRGNNHLLSSRLGSLGFRQFEDE